jgi:hypothetical protein
MTEERAANLRHGIAIGTVMTMLEKFNHESSE